MKVILVNIFAGINRCDWIAEGIIKAINEVQVKQPLVVRLAGTNVEKGQELLRSSGIKYEEAVSLQDAASKAVSILNQGVS